MKKILVIIIVLFTAIVTMAYLYFSGLNSERENNDSSLLAAAANSGFILSLQNDRTIFDILKGQDLLQEILGENNYKQIISIREHILSSPDIDRIIGKQNVYVGLLPGKDKQIDLLFCTQMNAQTSRKQLVNSLTSNKLTLDTAKKIVTLILPDSSVFYLGIKDNLLLLSNNISAVSKILSGTLSHNSKFVEHIKSTSRLTKNSLAEVYVNFETLPALLKCTMPGKLTGELSVLDNPKAFASLVYNFSKEKVLLTGVTKINDTGDYHQLFANSEAQKISITSLLPQNVANYTVFGIENYADWRIKLQNWFLYKKRNNEINNVIKNVNLKYHINPDKVFPKYFKNQLITFQLSTTEKIGAINLSNGEKVDQLLLDLSTDYDQDIRLFKESDLLFCYFGEPFRKFKRPYYIIIDNYMVFANNASTLHSFLNSYKNNRLLINNESYINSTNQLPNTSTISFYIDFNNSSDIFLKNIYLPYYRQFFEDKGLKDYRSFTYQLNGDNGKFQTNVLINKKLQSLNQNNVIQDSLINDSL